ncbi:hypothetical protein [Cryobacterium sp. CG_9.6]|uniref:hypothetical protein n=1 Tax=Cryobacterium sp. CG_9.6 TaxID=2760710 RepID=UPI0024737C56|nr:hypothetical protein [Cryobacterium sp. CG_9.6]MDH6237050.1 hypothetical protein [Cryobacterium sp. CG_9.6]
MDIKTADIATLNAALEVKQAELAAVEQGKRDTIQEAQRAWRMKLATEGEAMEEVLRLQQEGHHKTAAAAAASGDLGTAYKEFTAYHTSLRTRAYIRMNGQGAADALGLRYHTTAELRLHQLDFVEFLSQGLRAATERDAYNEIQQLIGDSPADYEAAVAYLGSNA